MQSNCLTSEHAAGVAPFGSARVRHGYARVVLKLKYE
jgi:hypothetical protein